MSERPWPPGAAALALAVLFAVPAGTAKAESAKGAGLYRRECAVCHGTEGKGDGRAASLMSPRPRDFERGLFKLRSTESGELPTTEDLIKTVTLGIPGTGMPSFRHLGDQAIAEVVAYLKTLGGPENEEGSWFELYEVPAPVSVPPMPAADPDRLALGEKLYAGMGCDGCHGKTGKGDGKPPEQMADDWGEALHARDFTLGIYKGGHAPKDLYVRVMTGMDGTPMTGFWKDAMSEDERWAVVQYIMTFGTPRPAVQPSRADISVSSVPAPSTIDDDAWAGAAGARLGRMAFTGGWMSEFEPFEVRVAGKDGELAVLVSWKDASNSCPSLRITFLEQGSEVPTFALGSNERSLTVWQWSKSEDAALVLASAGPGRDQRGDAKLHTEHREQGTRRSVLLRGSLARPSAALTVTAPGCSDRGSYLTSSTVSPLR